MYSTLSLRFVFALLHFLFRIRKMVLFLELGKKVEKDVFFSHKRRTKKQLLSPRVESNLSPSGYAL